MKPMSLASFTLALVTVALAATASAGTLVLPRSGHVGVGVFGDYGSLLKQGTLGSEFNSGPGLSVRVRYRMRYERALGLSFERETMQSRTHARPFPAGAFLGPTVQGDSLLSRDRLVVLLSGVELYQMFDTRSPNTKWVSATLGLAQVSSRLSDGEVQFPLEGDGPFLGVGAGLEHFFHRSWAWTADAHYHAIFHGGQVNHDLQASVGMIFYVAY